MGVFGTDLTGKVLVITGAGGVICGSLAHTLAKAGAKVALLDLNQEAAQAQADVITADGYTAKGYKCNVLEKESLEEAHAAILKDFGPCDILVNGAGGNNAKGRLAEFGEPHPGGNSAG